MRFCSISISVLLSLLVLVLGCSERVTSTQLDLQPSARSVLMQSGSYPPKPEAALVEHQASWTLSGQTVDIQFSAPANAQRLPLILYFPGLGENASGGRWWREYWAAQGYAVLSIQSSNASNALQQLPKQNPEDRDFDRNQQPDCRTLKEHEVSSFGWFGRGCRPATLAVDSELRYLGNQFFGLDGLKQRLQLVRAAFAHLKQQIAAGDPQYLAVDLDRIVVAGYELGAHTVSALIGESVAGLEPIDLGFKPMAAILISPTVDVASGNPKLRYRNIATPMLVISGTLDDDPYAISSAKARTALWEYATAPHQYLMVLNKADHGLLAGGEYMLHVRNRPMEMDRELDEQFRRDRSFARKLSPEERDVQQVAAIEATSTAFLDSLTKQQSAAQLWLDEQASYWLGASATWRSR